MGAKTEEQQTEQSSEAQAESQQQTDAEAAQTDNENLSDEARLAAEALAATEEPAEESPEIAGLKKENDSLLSSITARRQLLRELDKKLADKVAAEKAAEPPEKSPEEKFIEEHEDSFDPDTEPFPARVQTAQREWEKKQAEIAQKRHEEQSVSSTANQLYLKAKERFSDYDEIVMGAEDLLTEGDQVDVKNAIKRGKDGAELLYKRAISRTLEAGGDRAKQLKAKLRSKLPSKRASVQNAQETTDGSKKEEKRSVPANPPASAEDALTNPHLAHTYAAFGLT